MRQQDGRVCRDASGGDSRHFERRHRGVGPAEHLTLVELSRKLEQVNAADEARTLTRIGRMRRVQAEHPFHSPRRCANSCRIASPTNDGRSDQPRVLSEVRRAARRIIGTIVTMSRADQAAAARRSATSAGQVRW